MPITLHIELEFPNGTKQSFVADGDASEALEALHVWYGSVRPEAIAQPAPTQPKAEPTLTIPTGYSERRQFYAEHAIRYLSQHGEASNANLFNHMTTLGISRAAARVTLRHLITDGRVMRKGQRHCQIVERFRPTCRRLAREDGQHATGHEVAAK